MARTPNKFFKIVIPVVILGLGLFGASALIALKPEAEKVTPQVLIPLVRTIEAAPDSLQVKVQSQGSVSPRTVSQLVPEVSGRIVKVAP